MNEKLQKIRNDDGTAQLYVVAQESAFFFFFGQVSLHIHSKKYESYS